MSGMITNDFDNLQINCRRTAEGPREAPDPPQLEVGQTVEVSSKDRR